MTSPRSPTVALSTGHSMPLVGYGTWGLKVREVDTGIRAAVAAGYRLFDLAPVYGNEAAIGETLSSLTSAGTVQRSELFLTSKVPPKVTCDRQALLDACRQTLRDLRTPYLDLYLVHWPFCVRNDSPTWPAPIEYQLGYSPQMLRATWAAMEELHAAGLVRSIGLSNVGLNRLRTLLAAPDLRVAPSVLQVEHHPYLANKPLLAFAAARSPPIRVTGYCSLGSARRPAKYQHAGDPLLLDEPVLRTVSEAHGASAAAAALGWAVRRGVAVIPKSAHPERVTANLAETLSLAPKLTEAELAAIDRLDRNHRFLDDGARERARSPLRPGRRRVCSP